MRGYELTLLGVGYGDGLHGIGGGRLRWCGSEVVLRWWCMRRCGRSDGGDGVVVVGRWFRWTVVVWGEYGSGGDRGVKMVTRLMCGGCDEVER
ncbi:hypothetical protein Tco_1163882 [Tanacetum coccineum]